MRTDAQAASLSSGGIVCRQLGRPHSNVAVLYETVQSVEGRPHARRVQTCSLAEVAGGAQRLNIPPRTRPSLRDRYYMIGVQRSPAVWAAACAADLALVVVSTEDELPRRLRDERAGCSSARCGAERRSEGLRERPVRARRHLFAGAVHGLSCVARRSICGLMPTRSERPLDSSCFAICERKAGGGQRATREAPPRIAGERRDDTAALVEAHQIFEAPLVAPHGAARCHEVQRYGNTHARISLPVVHALAVVSRSAAHACA